MRLKIIFSLILIIFLFGCLDPTRGELNLCFSLASKSYANVPTCLSEEECFLEADKLLNVKSLGYEQQTNIYTLKNHLGRSWYFFNLAKTESEKISTACKAGNISSLPGSINQAKYYFDSAFSNLDQAMQLSFEVISREEKILTEEEIDLVKEEAAYDSLIELKQILSELESGKTNSGSYASYYFMRVEEFEKTAQNRNYNNLVENQPLWLKIYELVGGKLIEKSGVKNTQYIPLIGDIFKKSIGQIQTRIDYDQSLSALSNFPVYEMIKLYSETGGNKDSSIKRFFDLMSNINSNIEKLETSKSKLWNELNTKKAACILLLGNKPILETYPLINLKLGGIGEKIDYAQEFFEINKDIIFLREESSKGVISSGGEISLIKKILIRLTNLENNLTLDRKGLSERAGNYCSEKAAEIKSSSLDRDNSELNIIASNIRFYVEKVNSEVGERKLEFCEKMLGEIDLFFEADKDYEKYRAKKIDLTADCFDETSQIFKYYPSHELESLFENLKKTEVNPDNLYFFEESCQSILNQLKNELATDARFSELKNSYAELLILKSKFGLVCSEDQKYANDCKKIDQSVGEYSKYFLGGINYKAILPISEDLLYSLKNLVETQYLQYHRDVIDYVKTHTKTIVMSSSAPETNKLFISKNRVIVNNPFDEVNEEIIISFESTGKNLLEKDPVFGEIYIEQGKAVLKNVPSGISKFDYEAETIIKTFEETKIISISNLKSIYQKIITIDSEKEVPVLFVRTKKPTNTTKTTINVNGLEVAFSELEDIAFKVEQASKGSKINLFFYVDKVISLTKTLSETQSTGLNSNKIIYDIRAINNSIDSFDATIIIPFQFSEAISSLKLVDDYGKTQKADVYENSLVLNKQHFMPRESKTYNLTVYSTNIASYYTEIIIALKEKLIQIGENNEASKANRLINADYAEKTIKEAELFIENAEKLINAYEKTYGEQQTLITARVVIEEKIEELTKIISQLNENGFYKEANELSSLVFDAKNRLATGNIFELNKTIETLSLISFSPSELTISKSSEMWKEIQTIDLEDSNFLAIKNEFFFKKQKLDEGIISPLEASVLFSELNTLYNELIDINQSFYETSNAKKLLDDEALTLLFSEIEEKISFLKEELSINESDLIQAKFIQPITSSRLKKIELEVSKTKLANTSTLEKTVLLQSFLYELDDAINSIKMQAIARFNELVDLGTDNEFLSQGKTLIDSNKFTTALVFLKSETFSEKGFDLQVLSFAPIILIALIAFILKTKVTKHNSKKQEQTKEVLDKWED